jgi:hypothetical protein
LRRRYLFIAVFFLILLILVPTVECDIWDPFHTKEEKIAMWKNLWDSHTNTTYTSVGKTYNGTDILLFTAGNVSAKKVLWDGELHGNEDKGSEILFLVAEWLLKSGDPEATRILEETCVMFVPVINSMDERGNGNTEYSPYGVDLNRNFETGWRKSNIQDDEYSGPYPLSEPETQVMRKIFSDYKPVFYVNMHCGAGPYAAQFDRGNLTLGQQVITLSKAIANEMEITPYATRIFGSNGYAIGDAVALGVQSAWLIEAVGSSTAWRHLPEHYNELVTIFFPKCLTLFIAMCNIAASTSNVHPAPSPTPNATPESTSKSTSYPAEVSKPNPTPENSEANSSPTKTPLPSQTPDATPSTSSPETTSSLSFEDFELVRHVIALSIAGSIVIAASIFVRKKQSSS